MHEDTHTPSHIECQVTKIKVGIKRRAEETKEITQEILGTELRNISDGVAANLLTMQILRRNVRHSLENRNMPPTQAHREKIPDLPQAYRTAANGDPFLVYDSGVGDEERIFIFASRDPLQFLADFEHSSTFIVRSRSVRKFFSNSILYMVCVTEHFLCVCSHFCQ